MAKWHWVHNRLYGPERVKGDGPSYTGIEGTLVPVGLRERIAALLNAAEPGGDLHTLIGEKLDVTLSGSDKFQCAADRVERAISKPADVWRDK